MPRKLPKLTNDTTNERAETAGKSLAPASATPGDDTPTVRRTRRVQRLRSPSTSAIVLTNPAAVEVPGDQITQIIVRSLLNGREYDQLPDQQRAEFHLPYTDSPLGGSGAASYDATTGQLVITFMADGQHTWEHVLEHLALLGDEVCDTFCAFLALALEQNSPNDLTNPVKVSTDDILTICRRKRSNGIYLPEQRHAVIRHFDVLAEATVELRAYDRRRGWVARYSGPVVNKLGDSWGVYRMDNGETLWEQRLFQLGLWAHQAPHLREETAAMLRQVFAYHPQRERVAKRLGRYLTWVFAAMQRTTSSRSAPHLLTNTDAAANEAEVTEAPVAFEATMGELLDAAGVTQDRHNPNRTSRMIEDALARLFQDRVIGAYGRVVESTDEAQEVARLVDERAYGWFDYFLAEVWRFSPPHSVGESPSFPIRDSDSSGRAP